MNDERENMSDERENLSDEREAGTDEVEAHGILDSASDSNADHDSDEGADVEGHALMEAPTDI